MQPWLHLNNGRPEVIESRRVSGGDPGVSYDTATLTHCHGMLSVGALVLHKHATSVL